MERSNIMKYILDYLREEMFIEPVAGAIVDVIDEDIEPDTPIGHRLVLNGKETDIVVWFADYDAWLEKKYEETNAKLQEAYSIIERCGYDRSNYKTPDYDKKMD